MEKRYFESMNGRSPEVCILILNWNQRDTTLRCLSSLGKLSYPNYGILLVDNGSTDGSLKAVRASFPQTRILENPANLGAAGGRNIGIRYFLKETPGEYLLFLDNDVVVSTGLLEELIQVADADENIGIVGMKAYYLDDPNRFWAAGGGRINWAKGIFYDTGQNAIDNGQYDKERNIHSIPTGFTFVRREVLEKVGELDETYFIYYEDPDWCLRVRRAGYKIAFAPKAKVWHSASSSLGMESPSFYYYRTRNRLRLFLKHAGRLNFLIFFLYFCFWDFPFFTLSTTYLSRRPRQSKASILGFADFLRGRFGKREFHPQKDDFLDIPILAFLARKSGDLALKHFSRLQRNLKCVVKRILGRQLRVLMVSSWRLGDEVSLLPVYDKIRKRYPDAEMHVLCNYPEILADRRFLIALRKTDFRGYDLILDLRGERPAWSRWRNFERKLKIKIDRYPEIRIGGRGKKEAIGISIGAGWECKTWPKKYFEELASILEGEGFAIWVLGLENEKMSVGKDLTGVPLEKGMQALSRCRAFIGNDSGLLHLSLALGVPSIGLFGPTKPENLYMNDPLLYAIRSSVTCQGCWNREFMKYPGVCPYGTSECMAKIEAKEIWEKASWLLGKENEGSVPDNIS